METTCSALNLPRGVCGPTEVGNLGAFYKEPVSHERKTRTLLKDLVWALEKQLLRTIQKTSVQDYAEARMTGWPKYVRGLRALQDTARNLVSQATIQKMSDVVVGELQSSFEKRGQQWFGEKVTQQALFTLWTLTEIRALGKEIEAAGDVQEGLKDRDSELLKQYCFHSLWAQYHLDSLVVSLKSKRSVSVAIRGEVCEGLRSVVNAYTIMKEALSLRVSPVEEAPVQGLPWDEEDERLLASSMRGLRGAVSSDS